MTDGSGEASEGYYEMGEQMQINSRFADRVERLIDVEVQRRVAVELERLQADARAALIQRYEPTAEQIVNEAIAIREAQRADALVRGMADRPETHLPQLEDVIDWSSATASCTPATHVGRTIPAGPRSTRAWNGLAMKTARRDARLSKDEVALAVGVTSRCVRGWERNEYTPCRSHRAALATLLGVEV